MLSDGLAHLANTLADTDVAAELVTYKRRGKTDITDMVAVRGRNQPQSAALADGRADLTVTPQDWLVKPAAIDFGDGAADPADGDRIVDADGAVYELKPRDGEPSWRKSDPFGNMLRLRTTRES